jgi:hypothetical protein
VFDIMPIKGKIVEYHELIKALNTVWDYIWVGIAGLLAWVWQRINGDIKAAKAVADAAVPREEFKGFVERMIKSEENHRSDIKELFGNLALHFKDDKEAQEKLYNAISHQTEILTDRIDRSKK